jgi:hypothetical protein
MQRWLIYMASLPSVYNTAATVTSDDIAPALLALGALLLGASLGVSSVMASGVPPSPLADEFCTCSG